MIIACAQGLFDATEELHDEEKIVVHSHVICFKNKTKVRHVYFTINGSKFNHLDSKGNYSATSNNTKLVHWPLMDVTFDTARRGLGKLRPRPVLFSLYQM